MGTTRHRASVSSWCVGHCELCNNRLLGDAGADPGIRAHLAGVVQSSWALSAPCPPFQAPAAAACLPSCPVLVARASPPALAAALASCLDLDPKGEHTRQCHDCARGITDARHCMSQGNGAALNGARQTALHHVLGRGLGRYGVLRDSWCLCGKPRFPPHMGRTVMDANKHREQAAQQARQARCTSLPGRWVALRAAAVTRILGAGRNASRQAMRHTPSLNKPPCTSSSCTWGAHRGPR